MTRNLLRPCTNCTRPIPASNHAADFLCDDCRRMKKEREDHEQEWRADLREVNAEIRRNWREMKKLANETWELA